MPPHPEKDLLWFIAQYAPEMEPWERDIFLAVREESFYFYPVFACQIMNEGWASYWHARLLREADFLPQPRTWMRSNAIRMSCGRPRAATNRRAHDESLSPGLFDLGEDRRAAGPRQRAPHHAARTTISPSSAIT